MCLIEIIPISAQSLSEAEVSATMNRGFELYKTKQYSDALDAFLIVSANVDASKSEVERQVHVCSQMMACACYYFEKRYYEGYKLAKSLIAGKLSEDEKTETYKYYCKNGYMLALSYIKQDEQGYAEYKKGRDLLLEIEPYATGNLKDVIMQMVPLIWSIEGGLNICSNKSVSLNLLV